MTTLSKWLFKFGYDREWFDPIRDDFIEWYASGYDLPQIKEQFANVDTSKAAYRMGKQAQNFDPDNPILNTFDAFDLLRKKIKTVFRYLEGIALILGLSSAVSFQINLNILIPGTLMTAGALLLTPPFLYHIIRHQLRSSVDLVRSLNEQLAKTDSELWTEENERNIAGYFYWNRSLNKPNAHAVIIFLAIIRVISPRIYERSNEFLRENFTEYIERGVWDVSITELKQIFQRI